MLEIIALVVMAKQIGSIMREKGCRGGWYRLLLLVLWISGEFVGFVFGFTVTNGRGGLAAYVFALVGAAIGAAIAFWIANNAASDTSALRQDHLIGQPAALSTEGRLRQLAVAALLISFLAGCGTAPVAFQNTPTLIPPTAIPSPTSTPMPTATPTPPPGPKAGHWKGENKSGWPGKLTFQVDSSGKITDFNIDMPLFGGSPPPMCSVKIDNIPISSTGEFKASVDDKSASTAISVEGKFDAGNGATSMKISSVIGVCEGQLALLGIWYSAEWTST